MNTEDLDDYDYDFRIQIGKLRVYIESVPDYDGTDGNDSTILA